MRGSRWWTRGLAAPRCGHWPGTPASWDPARGGRSQGLTLPVRVFALVTRAEPAAFCSLPDVWGRGLAQPWLATSRWLLRRLSSGFHLLFLEFPI